MPSFSKPFLAALILLAALAGQSFGQQSTLVEVAPGDLVELVSTADPAASIAWEVLEPADFKFKLCDSERKFHSGTGNTARIIVLEFAITVEGGKPKISKTRHTVLVGGPAPNPNPNPIPIPGPIPDGAFGLTKTSYNSANKITGPARAKATAMGNNFESVGSKLAAGGYADVDAALSDLKQKNRDTTGEQRDAWLPFIADFSSAMETLEANGKVSTNQDFAAALSAVAAGLKLVK